MDFAIFAEARKPGGTGGFKWVAATRHTRLRPSFLHSLTAGTGRPDFQRDAERGEIQVVIVRVLEEIGR